MTDNERLQCALEGLRAIANGSNGVQSPSRRAWYEKYAPDAWMLKENWGAEMSGTLNMIDDVLEAATGEQ